MKNEYDITETKFGMEYKVHTNSTYYSAYNSGSLGGVHLDDWNYEDLTSGFYHNGENGLYSGDLLIGTE